MPREVLGVLADLVEDHHGVVEREPEDGQQAGDGRRGDLEPGQRVDADGDQRGRGPARRSPPTDIFHSRKYAQMNSTTSTRKTHQAESGRAWRPAAPQVAPIVVGADRVGRMTPTGFGSPSAICVGLVVVQRLGLDPDVVRAGGVHDRRGGRVDVRPACRRPRRGSWSTLAWVTWFDGMVTRYSTPPSNSMPRLRPRKYRPATASSTITPGDGVPEPLAADEVDRDVALVEGVAESARACPSGAPSSRRRARGLRRRRAAARARARTACGPG